MEKRVYPVILSEDGDGGYVVSVPDFRSFTEGKDLADAIYMARDLIGIMGITMQDKNMDIPVPYTEKVEKENDNDIITLVDIDFEDYRAKHDNRSVRKNCTIPYYLNEKAEKAGINFSRVLQEALLVRLTQ